jgi:hypothetical protein
MSYLRLLALVMIVGGRVARLVPHIAIVLKARGTRGRSYICHIRASTFNAKISDVADTRYGTIHQQIWMHQHTCCVRSVMLTFWGGDFCCGRSRTSGRGSTRRLRHIPAGPRSIQ